MRFGRVGAIQGLRLSALVARNGRVVVTWGSAGRPCGVAVRDAAGTWRSRTLERRCGPAGVATRAAPVRADRRQPRRDLRRLDRARRAAAGAR